MTPRCVDRQGAATIADAFLVSRSTPGTAEVRAAYRQLADQATDLYLWLTDHPAPWSVSVRFPSTTLPCDSAEELSIAVEHSVRWTSGQLTDHKALLLQPSLISRARDASGVAAGPDSSTP